MNKKLQAKYKADWEMLKKEEEFQDNCFYKYFRDVGFPFHWLKTTLRLERIRRLEASTSKKDSVYEINK